MTSGCGQDAMREQCRLVALGAGLEARFREPSALWRGRQAYTASALGGAARVQDPFGIPSGLATLSVYSTSDRLHSNEKGRRCCNVGLRATRCLGSVQASKDRIP
jgi:hypothetical protein